MKEKIKQFLVCYPNLNYYIMQVYKYTFWKYKQYRANKRFVKNVEHTFERLLQVLDELGMNWWLEYGTLLGAIRENNFLSHDVDIDIGMMHQEYSNQIEKTFIKYGFKKRREFLIDNGKYGREETYRYCGVDIDIFYFKQRNNTLIGYGFKAKDKMTPANTIAKYGGLLVRELTFPYQPFECILWKLERKEH